MITKHFIRVISISFLAMSFFCCNDKNDSANDRSRYELLQERVNNLQGKLDSLIQALGAKKRVQKNITGKSKKKNSGTAAVSSQQINDPTQQPAAADNNFTREIASPKKAPTPKPQRTYTTRVGAICCDGTRSSATGRGACSHHGGVCEWLYQ